MKIILNGEYIIEQFEEASAMIYDEIENVKEHKPLKQIRTTINGVYEYEVSMNSSGMKIEITSKGDK